MEIKKNLGNKINSNLLIKSLAWNCIVQVFKEQKNKDITPYLISVDIKWLTLFVKTQNPLVNSEIQMIENTIQEELKKKLKQVWVSFYDFEIRYL